MQDFLYSGRLDGLDMALAYGVFTEVSNEVVVRHDCDPVSAHLLGRSLGAASLASAALKPGERLNLHWPYTGVLRSLVVDVAANGRLRGLISPAHLSGKASDPTQLFGDSAALKVIRSGRDGQLGSGTVDAPFQDPVDDLAYYYSMSEQVETALCVMIGFRDQPERPVRICQGLLLQALPGCDLEVFESVRRTLDGERLRTMLGRASESDNYIEDLLHALLEQEEASWQLVIEERPSPRFFCTCSLEKMGAVVRALPYPDRVDIVKKGEPIQVRCDFCCERYTLTVDDCSRLWNEHRTPDASPPT